MNILITGASSGFGQRLADRLRAQGHTVFGTSRHPETAADPTSLISLDVRDDESVRQCIRYVERTAGPIDVLVNNAGYVHEGPFEELTIDELRAVFETNFFGAVRVTNAVLPAMRARRAGRIINIGSLAGVIPLPFVGAYCASKHALDSYSESLYYELRPFGIGVSVVEPGYFDTGIATRKLRTTPTIADYDSNRARMYRTIAHDENERSGAPDEVVSLLLRIIARNPRRLRHVLGPDAITYHLRGMVPEWVWDIGFRLATHVE